MMSSCHVFLWSEVAPSPPAPPKATIPVLTITEDEEEEEEEEEAEEEKQIPMADFTKTLDQQFSPGKLLRKKDSLDNVCLPPWEKHDNVCLPPWERETW